MGLLEPEKRKEEKTPPKRKFVLRPVSRPLWAIWGRRPLPGVAPRTTPAAWRPGSQRHTAPKPGACATYTSQRMHFCSVTRGLSNLCDMGLSNHFCATFGNFPLQKRGLVLSPLYGGGVSLWEALHLLYHRSGRSHSPALVSDRTLKTRGTSSCQG